MVFLFVNAQFFKIQPIQRFVNSAFFISGVVYLISHNLYGQHILESFSYGVDRFLDLSDYGSEFLFGNLAKEDFFGPWKEIFPNNGTWPGFGFLFAFKVLPTIIFFGGLMSVLYYIGIINT